MTYDQVYIYIYIFSYNTQKYCEWLLKEKGKKNSYARSIPLMILQGPMNFG